MAGSAFREWLAVAVLIGSFPLGAVLAGAVGRAYPNQWMLVLGAVFVLAWIGILVGKWPPIEYGLALVIACVLAGLLMPMFPVAVGLPGAGCGYLWGGWLAGHIDGAS